MTKKNSQAYRQLGQASMAGLMLAACIFVGTAIGIWLDRLLGTKPGMTLFFMVMGIVAGFYNVIKTVAALGTSKDKK